MRAPTCYRLNPPAKPGPRGARLTTQLLARIDQFLGVVLLGNNLLDERHPEFGTAPNRGETERTWGLTLSWTF